MNAAQHRKTDDSGNHEDEREWNGPTRSQWDALCTSVEQGNKTLADIRIALFGEIRDGINGDGGVVNEVRKLRSIRVVAWSAIVGVVGIIATAVIESLIGKRMP